MFREIAKLNFLIDTRDPLSVGKCCNPFEQNTRPVVKSRLAFQFCWGWKEEGLRSIIKATLLRPCCTCIRAKTWSNVTRVTFEIYRYIYTHAVYTRTHYTCARQTAKPNHVFSFQGWSTLLTTRHFSIRGCSCDTFDLCKQKGNACFFPEKRGNASIVSNKRERIQKYDSNPRSFDSAFKRSKNNRSIFSTVNKRKESYLRKINIVQRKEGKFWENEKVRITVYKEKDGFIFFSVIVSFFRFHVDIMQSDEICFFFF